MANWWDWTSTYADREGDRQESLAKRRLAQIEADYDRQVQAVREDNLRLSGPSPWGPPQPGFFRSLPPEVRMRAMSEVGLLGPKNPSPGYTAFLGEAVRYPLELGARPRDTLFRSAQEMAAGDYGAGLGYAAAAPVSALVPYVAAGRHGDDDDWREAGRRLGLSDRNLLMIDIGTDPTTYFGYGALRALPRIASRSDDILRALQNYGGQMRYGRGVPTYIEDAAGNTIGRLRNSPGGVLSRLAIPQQ